MKDWNAVSGAAQILNKPNLNLKQDVLTGGTANVPGLTTALATKQVTLTSTADVPGLDTALSGKQATLTSTADIPGLNTTLSGKQATLTSTSDVPGLDTALGGKQATLSSTADVPGLDTALSGKQATLSGTTDVPGLTTALGSKQATLTSTDDVPGLERALSGKQATLTSTADVPGLDTVLSSEQSNLTFVNSFFASGNGAIKEDEDSGIVTYTPPVITATAVGLGNVNNTSDANKPVSTAQQTALDLKANVAGANFTGFVVADAGIIGHIANDKGGLMGAKWSGYYNDNVTLWQSQSLLKYPRKYIYRHRR